jgi:hypothetical protein
MRDDHHPFTHCVDGTGRQNGSVKINLLRSCQGSNLGSGKFLDSSIVQETSKSRVMTTTLQDRTLRDVIAQPQECLIRHLFPCYCATYHDHVTWIHRGYEPHSANCLRVYSTNCHINATYTPCPSNPFLLTTGLTAHSTPTHTHTNTT